MIDTSLVESYLETRDDMLFSSLEVLLTSDDGFGLKTASPLQRAVCRVLDGKPIGRLWKEPHVAAAFGGQQWTGGVPHEMVLLSGIRSGKSFLVAARGLQLSQTCVVDHLVTGEVPRVSIVSTSKDLAQVIYGYIVGHLRSKPKLSKLLIGDPTSDSVTVRHPTGRPVEIRVTAGSRAGSSLVARWSAGVIFDEAPRMLGQEDGVVNLDDARAAVLGRLLPGASILYPGSPWAPFGPVYRMTQEHHGKAGAKVCVVRAPAYAMNPVYWTPQRCAELRDADPDVYLTDVEAQFADRTTSFVPRDAIEAVVQRGQARIPCERSHQYVAAIDPATRGNAWTLGIGTKDAAGRFVLARARQWQGSSHSPLRPASVLEEMRYDLMEYGLDSAWTDQWSYDALSEIARERGIRLFDAPTTAASQGAGYATLRAAILERRIVLCAEPGVVDDLARVQRKVTQAGMSYVLPLTADGRHCDYAAMLALLVTRPMQAPSVATQPTWDRWGQEEDLMRAAALQSVRDRPGGEDDL